MDTLTTLIPYIWLTFNALLTASLFALAVRTRVRGRYMIAGAATMILMGVWFAMIAVSAGPNGHTNRSQFAAALRLIALAAGPLWSIWLVMYAHSIIRIEKRREM